MKKIICVLLAAFMLIVTPIKGYAAGAVPVVWGITEEYVLAFLASLLGVQAVGAIDTNEELRAYNNELYNGLLDTLAGAATAQQISVWIANAVLGSIDTDSVIWQKFYEFCIGNYVAQSANAGTDVEYSGSLGNYDFVYYQDSVFSHTTNTSGLVRKYEYAFDNVMRVANTNYLYASDQEGAYTYNFYQNGNLVSSSVRNANLNYTYDGKTVYYGNVNLGYVLDPVTDIQNYGSNVGVAAWLMVYGGYTPPVENVGSVSEAFGAALSQAAKDAIVDGTSVIQLYNPADVQNGLHIVPDPEDPDKFEIPYFFTADWYNFFKQFGASAADTYAEAYNAINGLVGAGTSAVSDLYNKLGVASVLNTAADAAAGVAALTSQNIYPYNLTASDAISEAIPGSLTPQSPDSGIDNESPQGLYKLPDLRDYFPFCIPFDLIDLLSCFVAEPETPEFVIALSTGWEYAEETVSLDQWNGIAQMVRNVELAVFILGLILMTRNLIRG